MLFKNQFFITSLVTILTTSCVNTQNATYFVNQRDTTLVSSTTVPESYIQNNNLLNISVSSLNPEASAIFNPIVNNSIQSSSGPAYLVDPDGYIQFPILGSIKAAGLTKLQLKESIVKNLIDKKLLLDPIVNVRLVNYKITVLGEVNKPSVIPVPNEKITLLEAIGFAGDLTLYAKRDNVLLIREEQGKKTIRRLNLSSSDIFNSPYYYLKSDDVVYVEANKAKVASTTSTRLWLPVLFSGLSLAAIVIDRITR